MRGTAYAPPANAALERSVGVTGAKPAGLFPILEEHGLLHRKPDDKALLRAYHDAHAATPEPRGGKPRAYAKPRFDDGLHFQLRHYAGAVDYDVSGWIVKNNDALAHDLLVAVRRAKKQLHLP